MSKTFFTVGPTQVHPQLETFIRDALAEHIPSISHRGKSFSELYAHTVASVKKLLNVPEGHHVFFLGSATEAMERVIENCVAEHSLHFVNGSFSKRFFETAEELKKKPQKVEVAQGQSFDFSNVAVPPEVELVCITQNETSTGVAVDMQDVYVLKRKHPEKLFAVDIVSSAPYVDIDYSLIDCTFFSVQKGFGMPAGLGVLVVNDACVEKSKTLQEKGTNIGSYHNFPVLLGYEAKHQTPETPNVLGLYLLGRICDSYIKQGIERIREETDEKADAIYSFFEKHGTYHPFVKNAAWRSKTTIVIDTPEGSGPVTKTLADNGFIVSSGYGKFKDTHIRIANFPSQTLEDTQRMLKLLK